MYLELKKTAKKKINLLHIPMSVQVSEEDVTELKDSSLEVLDFVCNVQYVIQ